MLSLRSALWEGRGPQLYLKTLYWKEIDLNGFTIKLDREPHFIHCIKTHASIASSLAFAISCFVKLKSSSYLMQ